MEYSNFSQNSSYSKCKSTMVNIKTGIFYKNGKRNIFKNWNMINVLY
jgi:hypothetical protein